MRLIDADELIKVFLNVCRTEFEIKNKCLADENVLSIIQNAPTVTIKEWTEEMPIYIKDAMLEALRPQGEWQLHGMIYYCSECGHECGESGDNFCGNCGADMKGGRE